MNKMPLYNVGIDIGSTTAKVAILDSESNLVYKNYIRHNTRVYKTLAGILSDAIDKLGNIEATFSVTGSAGIGIAENFNIPFVQEVIAATGYLKRHYSNVKTLIDIGGEDSKMIFFRKGKTPDIRMNGSCAGGTGAFIDQMASLLDIPVQSLNDLAKKYENIYPVASRCGVFAKTDIQNLISRKISIEDIIASVYNAVATQVLNTLARGFDIEPSVVFSGGPFSFMPQLQHHFMQCLKLKKSDIIEIKFPELLPAMGAAEAKHKEKFKSDLKNCYNLLINFKGAGTIPTSRLNPLFKDLEEIRNWKNSFDAFKVPRTKLSEYKGRNCYLGLDSGSTTTKICLTGENNEILFTYYSNNKGNAIKTAIEGLQHLRKEFPSEVKHLNLAGSVVTGYGEDLIRAALNLNGGTIETIAHFQAAKYFNKDVSFILDIGGQDMKAIFCEEGHINRIELNEACSSGCGSFIESFGSALGYTRENFAKLATTATAPCDLGTRCTVFMNSKVKQSLRENASTEDISAGLAISVIKNALYKVLKITDPKELGNHIVVQGGTFKNQAVLKALQDETNRQIICSDIPEMMGAFGAALLAKTTQEHRNCQLNLKEFSEELYEDYTRKKITCKGCENLCTITAFKFKTGLTYYSGNKCEKVFSSKGENSKIGENFSAIKKDILFKDAYKKSKTESVKKIGIPRALNIYESFHFWNTLFTNCGYEVVLSSPSSMDIYTRGQGTIMSDSICFPAKLVHGHILDLVSKQVDRIFYPTVVYEKEEFETSNNSYNCPIVTGYPDVIKNSVNTYKKHKVPLDNPVISFRNNELLQKAIFKYLKGLKIKKTVYTRAFEQAVQTQKKYRDKIKTEGAKLIKKANDNNEMLIVLSGRPYHIDSLINHKTPEILAELGANVITEDALPVMQDEKLSDLHIITQWAFPNRIYNAAQWVAQQGANVQMVQLNSFGCGPDAIVVDEVSEILKSRGKFNTVIRVDEITSTGSVRLRIRSLLESLKLSNKENIKNKERHSTTSFGMDDKKRTILAPVFSDIYSRFFPSIFSLFGYKLVNLPLPDKKSVDYGLKYSNNEICYPATIIVGDIIKALEKGDYKRDEIAIGITQTGGQCRASSYLSLIKKGMVNAGYQDIPVISVGTSGITINDQPGFVIDWNKAMLVSFVAVLYADSLSKMYYSTAVREAHKGSAKKLLNKYLNDAQKHVLENKPNELFSLLKKAVEEFNGLEVKKGHFPKIGIVGEIYVKYNAFGNKFAVDWLIEQGIEVVVPPLLDFFTQVFVNFEIDKKLHLSKANISSFYLHFIEKKANRIIKKANKIMTEYNHHSPFHKIREISEKAERVISLANQYGEGWLIPAEISAFADDGIHNVVSLQPFGCIANHVISKGIEKGLRDLYPDLNILYLDFDDGASEVNIINRLHFMVKNVKEGY